MTRFVQEGFHWLRLLLFKPVTLAEEAEGCSKGQALRIYLETFVVGAVSALVVLSAIGSLCQAVGFSFDWGGAFVAMGIGLGVGLVFGLISLLVFWLGVGLVAWLVVGLFLGLVVALNDGLVVEFELSRGLFSGLGGGLSCGLFVGLVGGLDGRRFVGLVGGLVFGLVGALNVGLNVGLSVGLEQGITEGVYFIISYIPCYALAFFRPFYVLPHLWQYRKALRTADSFTAFRRSPIHWDEAIALPLPGLSEWLVQLCRMDRERGIEEMQYVFRKCPYQRHAAQWALLRLAVEELDRIDSVESLAKADEVLRFLPEDERFLPKGLKEAQRRINAIAELAKDLQTRVTAVGRAELLGNLKMELDSFQQSLSWLPRPVGPDLAAVAGRWRKLVAEAATVLQKEGAFTPIPNPFVIGHPLQARDGHLFKGRRAIIVAIEENILNPNQRPALLLYGRRRIGKSSTLLNLPRLVSSRLIPVYIDFQDAAWREADAVFCCRLAGAIYKELDRRELAKNLVRPKLEAFEKYAFSKLNEFFDDVEEISRRQTKQILITFDEFERLEEGIAAKQITLEICNHLRNIVQHREQLVVLFSGSHRFEELRAVKWADYLINVKTLELSFLDEPDARELITRPVPEFNLEYEPGVVERIIELTHGQPYLLQAVASELVNHLNSQNRLRAAEADLEVAIERTLVSAQAYFYFTWSDELSDAERYYLRSLARDGTQPASITPSVLQGLRSREIVEQKNDRWDFTIPLFMRWVLRNELGQDRTADSAANPRGRRPTAAAVGSGY